MTNKNKIEIKSIFINEYNTYDEIAQIIQEEIKIAENFSKNSISNLLEQIDLKNEEVNLDRFLEDNLKDLTTLKNLD